MQALREGRVAAFVRRHSDLIEWNVAAAATASWGQEADITRIDDLPWAVAWVARPRRRHARTLAAQLPGAATF